MRVSKDVDKALLALKATKRAESEEPMDSDERCSFFSLSRSL